MKALFVLFFAMVMFVPGATAAEAQSSLSWVAPQTRVDNTPMELSEIAEYRVFYSIDGTPSEDSTMISVDGETTAEVINIELTPRIEPYVISFAILVVDTKGLTSELSEPVSKTFDVDSTARPSVPTELQFKFSCVNGCTITEITGSGE